MDPMQSLGGGFKSAFNQRIEFGWEFALGLALILVGLLLFGGFDSLILRYRRHSRAQRRERRKRELLSRLVYDDSCGALEREILQRLTGYYTSGSDPDKIQATSKQLVHFSQTLFALIRRLEYDKQGRLVIPSYERHLRESGATGNSSNEKKIPKIGFRGDILHRVKSSGESLNRAARVALDMIRLRQQP